MPDNENLFTAVTCIDKPGEETTALRQDMLAVHLDYIETILDEILVAGPLYDDDGETIAGSLLIYRAGDEAARALLQNDPYFKAGLWSEVRFNPFLAAAGTAVGGKTW